MAAVRCWHPNDQTDQLLQPMENHAVQPDILVENTPEDNLAGRDRQLETAVSEVMKELKPHDTVAKTGKE